MRHVLLLITMLYTIGASAQQIRKKDEKNLNKRASFTQLTAVDKSQKIFINITKAKKKSNDRARFGDEIKKQLALNGFKVTSNKDDAGYVLEGTYSHDFIVQEQILGFNMTLYTKDGDLVLDFGRNTSSFASPLRDYSVGIYLANKIRTK